jgi:hypothetical protein
MLAEIARPTITEHYEPWGRDIAYRRLSAAQFVRVAAMQAALPRLKAELARLRPVGS